jgi:hypothetical protein
VKMGLRSRLETVGVRVWGAGGKAPKIATKAPGFAIYITMVLAHPAPTERVIAGGMSLVKLGVSFGGCWVGPS